MNYSRLLVLGGAGNAGRQLITEALARGYQVTALARTPATLDDMSNPQLEVRAGDMCDASALEALLSEGFDAVLSTLGIFQKSPGTPLADMSLPLFKAMELHGPQRIVMMSSLGVGDSKGQGNLLVKFVTGKILKHVLVDKALQEEHLKNSSLQWTVLRPPRLLMSDKTAPYRLWQGRDKPPRTKWQISTRDAACEMLNLLEEKDSILQAYQCSY
jgi:uncharacterized protein YbjT (DUF2867 family)